MNVESQITLENAFKKYISKEINASLLLITIEPTENLLSLHIELTTFVKNRDQDSN